MPDAGSRAPRRTRHALTLETIERDLTIARRQHDADVAAILRLTGRAEHAERLLASAVTALGEWRDDAGALHPIAAAVLVDIVADVLGIDPDQRAPRARIGDVFPVHIDQDEQGYAPLLPPTDEPPNEP